MTIQQIGDGCISFQFSNIITLETSKQILHVYHMFNRDELFNRYKIIDIVPTYCSIAFHFDASESFSMQYGELLHQEIENALINYKEHQSDEIIEPVIMPTVYNGRDLKRVGDHNGISIKEVVRKHCQSLYLVAMIGFRPHFPYLIGLDKALETARLDSPRLKIPAGSVAIGGLQTGIYPEESPGGWNLIGITDPSLLVELKPGDYIRFDECTGL